MASKAAEEVRFSVLSHENVKLYAEVVGVTGLEESLMKSLAEDATYRIREALQKALQFMKHAKRRRMTTEDFNRAVQLSSLEPIYGYGSGEDMPFRSASTKDGDIYFVDDKEICIRELALGTVIPTDPGKVTVRAQWLCIEGSQPTANHAQLRRQSAETENGAQQKPLSEVCLGYYEQITKAVLGESEKCRKVALDDLRSNPRIASLLAYFVNFIASGVKSYSHDLKQLSRLLCMVKALTDNPSLFLEPYVIQLVTAVMYCLLETLAVSLNPSNDHWRLRDDAARILAHISRKCSNPINYLRQQLLMTLQEVLLDDGRPYCSHYGAVVGLAGLGSESLEQFLLPHLKTYWQQLQQVLEDNTPANAVLQEEAIQVYGALLQAAGCLLKSKSQGVPMNSYSFPVNNSHPILRANLSPWPGTERRPAPVSATRSRSSSVSYNLPNQSYHQLYNVFGDSLMPIVAFNNWQDSSITKANLARVQPITHAYFPLRPLQRESVIIRERIQKAKDQLAAGVSGDISARVILHAGRKRSRTDDDDDAARHHDSKREKRGKYSALVLKPPTKIHVSPAISGVFELASPPRKGAEHGGVARKKGGKVSKKKTADAPPKEPEKKRSEPSKTPQLITGSAKKMFCRARPGLSNKTKYDYHMGVVL